MASSNLDHPDILKLRQQWSALNTGKSGTPSNLAAFVPSTLSEAVSGKLPLLMEVGAMAAQWFRRRAPIGRSSALSPSARPRRRGGLALLRPVLVGTALAGVAYLTWRFAARPEASTFGRAGRDI